MRGSTAEGATEAMVVGNGEDRRLRILHEFQRKEVETRAREKEQRY